MKFKNLFTIAAAVSATLTLTAQTTQKFTATKANEYGIAYTLPSTMLDITIETETTVKEPGRFYKYAKKYLNVDNPISEKSVSVKVKSVIVTTRGVADPERRYLVNFKPGTIPFMMINDENLPISINTEKVLTIDEVKLPVAVDAKPTPLETDAARQVFSEEMLQSQSTAKRAELAAAQIYALRQSRTDFITGQAESMPPDGKAMQIVMDNIEAQEAALVAMFVGTTKISTRVSTVSFDPSEDVTDMILARISPDGVVEPDDLSGAPLYISVTTVEHGKMPVDDKGKEIPFPKNGFAYCIPGKAQVKITFDGKTMVDKRIELAQSGVVYGLNPNSFTDKKEPIYLIFDPTTGAAAEIGSAAGR